MEYEKSEDLISNSSFPGNSHKNGTDSSSSINHSSLDTDEDMGKFVLYN